MHIDVNDEGDKNSSNNKKKTNNLLSDYDNDIVYDDKTTIMLKMQRKHKDIDITILTKEMIVISSMILKAKKTLWYYCYK